MRAGAAERISIPTVTGTEGLLLLDIGDDGPSGPGYHVM